MDGELLMFLLGVVIDILYDCRMQSLGPHLDLNLFAQLPKLNELFMVHAHLRNLFCSTILMVAPTRGS